MNYEIQYKRHKHSDWNYWLSVNHRLIKGAREHVALLRDMYPEHKFRIVRVTRKVVAG